MTMNYPTGSPVDNKSSYERRFNEPFLVHRLPLGAHIKYRLTPLAIARPPPVEVRSVGVFCIGWCSAPGK